MLHIAIIDPVGQKAGLDHYDRCLAKALNNRFCNVKIYSNFSDVNNESIIENHFTFTFRNDLLKLPRLIKEYFSALRKAEADKTGIIIIHIFHSSIIDFLFIRLADLFGFRICLIIHDVESLIHQQRKTWISKCVNLASYVIVHNNLSYDELIERIKPADKGKVFIIPHGNYVGLQEKTESDQTAAYFNLDSNKIYLLFFGMIKRSKGLEVLIDAMKDIPANVDLIIAGRTRNISFIHYETLIRKLNLLHRVHPIIRYITNTERNLLFNFADLAILPYQRIYQSGVMLLAMSYGIPVIASDLPANKLIIDDKNGTLFKVGDSSDLAAKINDLIADEGKRNYISECAREFVTINNDWNKIGDDFLKIFN